MSWLFELPEKLRRWLCLHDDVDPGTFICNQCGRDVEYTFLDGDDV